MRFILRHVDQCIGRKYHLMILTLEFCFCSCPQISDLIAGIALKQISVNLELYLVLQKNKGNMLMGSTYAMIFLCLFLVFISLY